jgi:hypothetical protein
LFHIGLAVGLIVSVTALGAAGYAVYVLVEPGHAEQRVALDRVLGKPRPQKARPGASARPASPASPKPEPPPGSPVAELPAAPSAAPRAETPAAPVPATARAPAASPWTATPPELARLVPHASRPKGLDKHEMVAIHEYNAKHVTDPRGHLVLARSYVVRRWFKDAISEYEIALKVSDASRGDPRVLHDLLWMVELGSAESAKLVVHVFGDAAVPAIDKALTGHLPNPEAKVLLERLREEAAKAAGGGEAL